MRIFYIFIIFYLELKFKSKLKVLILILSNLMTQVKKQIFLFRLFKAKKIQKMEPV